MRHLIKRANNYIRRLTSSNGESRWKSTCSLTKALCDELGQYISDCAHVRINGEDTEAEARSSGAVQLASPSRVVGDAAIDRCSLALTVIISASLHADGVIGGRVAASLAWCSVVLRWRPALRGSRRSAIRAAARARSRDRRRGDVGGHRQTSAGI